MSKTTESWADWILSSYSEAINSPLPEHQSTEPEHQPTEPESDSSDASPNTNSSPWGPYKKSGRGGAGNFAWQPDLPHDVEMKRQTSPHGIRRAATASDATEHADKVLSKKRPANIVTGRGGVGNVVPPTYAPGTPRSPTWALPPSSPSCATPRSASAVYGRGGVGNFAASSLALIQAKDEKVDEERRMAEGLRERAEHDVENMIRPPEDAFLAGARRRESGVGM